MVYKEDVIMNEWNSTPVRHTGVENMVITGCTKSTGGILDLEYQRSGDATRYILFCSELSEAVLSPKA